MILIYGTVLPIVFFTVLLGGLWYSNTPDEDEGKYRILKDLNSRSIEYYRVQMWHHREWKDISDDGLGFYENLKNCFSTLEKAIEMRDYHQKNWLEEWQRKRTFKQARKKYPIEISESEYSKARNA